MTDTVKLIIEIPKEVKADIDNGVIRQNIDKIYLALAHGTPLDDVMAEIEDLDRFYDNDYSSGNRDSMFKCNEVMQIFDNIGKAESEDT